MGGPPSAGERVVDEEDEDGLMLDSPPIAVVGSYAANTSAGRSAESCDYTARWTRVSHLTDADS
jgi:hypothetical protein